ncbi:hypothetical protein EVC12_091 [Rhizobium phage RHph_I42]|nr:hypothetical protein EVC12_091 [Rhizobium phage RHph_I42]
MKSKPFYLDEYPTVAALAGKLHDEIEKMRDEELGQDWLGDFYHTTSYDFTTGRYMMTLTTEQPT